MNTTLKIDWSSPKTWLGILAILAFYINGRPDLLTNLGFNQVAKAWLWEVAALAKWFLTVGYLMLQHMGSDLPPPPVDPEKELQKEG